MSDVKWIKIATDIFDDEKILLIESLPESDSIIVIWFKLLSLAGKNNNSGVFMLNEQIAYTDEMFATIFRRNINTVRLAIDTFNRFGMIDIIENVVTIPNWSKHQTLDKIEKNNEYMKNYMRGRREQQKLLACKTNSKTNSKVNKQINSKSNCKVNVSGAELELELYKQEKKNIYVSFFEKLWSLYPKKQGKGSVTDKKKKELFEYGDELVRAVERYKEYVAVNKTDFQYIKMGSSFFNTGYIDYLDENYMQQEQPKPKKQGRSGVNDDVPNPKRRYDY